MTLLLLIIGITISIGCEAVSMLIYLIIIRKKLFELDKNAHLSLFPHKRKIQVDEYLKHFDSNSTRVHWGKIVIWLNKISWMTLLISSIIALFLIIQ